MVGLLPNIHIMSLLLEVIRKRYNLPVVNVYPCIIEYIIISFSFQPLLFLIYVLILYNVFSKAILNSFWNKVGYKFKKPRSYSISYRSFSKTKQNEISSSFHIITVISSIQKK